MKLGCEYTHFCDDHENKTFTVYNIKDKITNRIQMPYVTSLLFDSVQVGGTIYFSGGGTSGNFFKLASRVTLTPDGQDIDKIEKLPNMNLARAKHTLAAPNPNEVYAIGGANETGDLADCEAFLVDKNQWVPCPSLNEPKAWVSVCAFNAKSLYAFGGAIKSCTKEIETIEYLDTTNKSAKTWTKIELGAGKELWRSCFFIGSIQLDEESIMLFGGAANKTEFNTTFYFQPATKALVKGPNLAKKDAFYRTKPGRSATEISIVGSSEGDMHIYNVGAKSWKVMIKATWDPESGRDFKADTS